MSWDYKTWKSDRVKKQKNIKDVISDAIGGIQSGLRKQEKDRMMKERSNVNFQEQKGNFYKKRAELKKLEKSGKIKVRKN